MYVFRGRADTPEQDREYSRRLRELAGQRGTAHLRVWSPPQHVAFGRRDSAHSNYGRARAHVDARAVPTVERTTGGHAVYFTGQTVSLVLATPVDNARSGITDRYEQTTDQFRRALADLGVATHEGEPDGAFCPGTHSLSAEGKIVGLAQRVRREVAVVAGIVVVRDNDAIAKMLGPVYDALDIPLEPDATGSLARAGGVADPTEVARTIESAFAEDNSTIERF